VLIVMSGLPGVGKSAVAEALARATGAVHLSIDAIEDGLLAARLEPDLRTGIAAYEAVRAAAELNLALGHTVVVDAVNRSELARETWRRASRTGGTPLLFVLLTLDRSAEHRRRLEQRSRPLVHVPEPSWADVEARAAGYEPWVGDDLLVLDASRPVADSVAAVEAEIERRRLAAS
jgi:predicted kinase